MQQHKQNLNAFAQAKMTFADAKSTKSFSRFARTKSRVKKRGTPPKGKMKAWPPVSAITGADGVSHELDGIPVATEGSFFALVAAYTSHILC